MKFRALFALLVIASTAAAWSNGFSAQNKPTFADSANQWSKSSMYGTHDFLAEYAMSFLPASEKAWIQNNTFLYGTELPDSTKMSESIGDRGAQFITFDSMGNVINDSLAARATLKYDYLVNSLKTGADVTASKWAGAMASYVSDAALFPRVIQSSQNGLKFEGYMQTLTGAYPSEKFREKFGSYISFDGNLEMISPYDAILRVGQATYLGKKDGTCSAQWMEDHYDPNSPDFIACAGRDLNNAVNAIADVIHTAYQASKGQAYTARAYDWANSAKPAPPVQQPAAPPEKPEQPTAEQPAGNGSQDIEVPVYSPPSKAKPQKESAIWLYLIAIIIVAVVAFAVIRLVGRRRSAGVAEKLTEKPRAEKEKIGKKQKKAKVAPVKVSPAKAAPTTFSLAKVAPAKAAPAKVAAAKTVAAVPESPAIGETKAKLKEVLEESGHIEDNGEENEENSEQSDIEQSDDK